MRFRNLNTGHILSTDNKACIEMMQASPAYEVIVDAPVAEVPVAEEAPKASKPKTSKAKASK